PPITPEPIPTPAPPAPNPPPNVPSCGTACAAMQALGCPEGFPTDAGATCVEVCTAMQGMPAIGYPVACVSQASTCAAVDACWDLPRRLSPKVDEGSLP